MDKSITIHTSKDHGITLTVPDAGMNKGRLWITTFDKDSKNEIYLDPKEAEKVKGFLKCI